MKTKLRNALSLVTFLTLIFGQYTFAESKVGEAQMDECGDDQAVNDNTTVNRQNESGPGVNPKPQQPKDKRSGDARSDGPVR